MLQHILPLLCELSALQDRESVSAALQGETFYEGDNPMEENEDSDKDAWDNTDSDSFSPVCSDFDACEDNSDDGDDNNDRQISSTPKRKVSKVHSVADTNINSL